MGVVIRSFGSSFTEDIWNGTNSARARKFPADVLPAALRKLDMLNAAAALDDLGAVPGNRLELLKGNFAGYHSIRINRQWRVVFRWTDAGPEEVQIIDYH